MEIYKDFGFEAAHRLPAVPPDHKCHRLHGHSFRIRVHVRGPVDETAGWITDFATISAAVQPVIARLDHYYLNDVPGLENPTSERIARWLWQQIAPQLSNLARITVQETCTSGCHYDGELDTSTG